jgi:hypothetical protein
MPNLKRTSLKLLTSLSLVLGPVLFMGITSASASGKSDCPSRNICFWIDTNYNTGSGQGNDPWGGTEPANHGGSWYNFRTQFNWIPDSAYSNSGSAIYLYEHSTGSWECLSGGASDGNLHYLYGYYYITYGVSACHGLPGGAP